MTVHQLKIEAQWYERLVLADKTCEVRRGDRDYQRGDHLTFTVDGRSESGRWEVSHVLDLADVPGLHVDDDGRWVVLSLRRHQ